MGGLESSTIVLVEAGRVCGASRLLHLGPGLEDSAFCDDHRLETGDALFGPRVDIGWFFDDELHLDDVIVGIVLRRVSERLDGPVRGISRRDRVSELIACCGERAGGPSRSFAAARSAACMIATTSSATCTSWRRASTSS